MGASKPKRIIVTIISLTLLAATMGIAYFLTHNKTEIRSRATANTAPITGTFFLSDLVLTYSEMGQMVDEWKSMGMDTVITLGIGELKKVGTSYVEDDWTTKDNPYRDIIKIAADRGMKLYVGLASIDPAFWRGNAENQARTVDFSKRLVGSLKTYCLNYGIPWDSIAGFYIGTEASWGEDMTFQKNIAAAVKSVAPDKKILIAPYMGGGGGSFNAADTTRYIRNLGIDIFQRSSIDIVATQDGLGAGLANYIEAKTVYSALVEALAQSNTPGKEIWADVETFEFIPGSNPKEMRPAPFTRVQTQIETWKPYVTKNVSWLYQSDMQLNPPVFNNAGRTWNVGYTYSPDNATRRAALRTAYMNAYGIAESTPMPTVSTAPVTGFSDVPNSHTAYNAINTLYKLGIVSGCTTTPLQYCPSSPVTRAAAAVFILRSKHGGSYTPPDVTATRFGDVPGNYWAADWIEELAAEGIVGSCSTTATMYCPEGSLTREQIAVILLRAKHQPPAYTPPAATGIFNDVAASYWAAAWIEQFKNEGITSGCGNNNFCPTGVVSRADIAIFLVSAFGLTTTPATPTTAPPTITPIPTPTNTLIPTLTPTQMTTRYIVQNMQCVGVTTVPANTQSFSSLSACVGYLNTLITPTPTLSPGAVAGDLNGDSLVNVFDYRILVAGFGTTYTIFDYRSLVANYGR